MVIGAMWFVLYNEYVVVLREIIKKTLILVF